MKYVYAALRDVVSLIGAGNARYDEFLLLLDRDRPSQRLCSRHKTFKPIDDTGCKERSLVVSPSVQIPWGRIQLAMRSIHYGLPKYGLAWSDLQHSWDETCWTCHYDARVADGRLLLRVEAKAVLNDKAFLGDDHMTLNA